MSDWTPYGRGDGPWSQSDPASPRTGGHYCIACNATPCREAATEARRELLAALGAVLNASHGPVLGSGASYRHCACAVHEKAWGLIEVKSSTDPKP